MRVPLGFATSAVVLVLLSSLLPGGSTSHPYKAEKQFSQYREVAGANRVGAETCAACHADEARDARHAFHAQQGVECEDCHGNGSLHVDGGGDVSKIVSFRQRSVADANGACLGCHARDASVRYWQGGPHSANHVRCIDCHLVHAKGLQAAGEKRLGFETSTQGALTAELVSPETDVALRSRAETNHACLQCHQSENAQLSLPYHHPVREGKMSCVDCHDPHGGPAGNNLRAASLNELCLGCHAQYRGPFTYQHPPVSENCVICHVAHGSPNTNLLSVSMPALCLQCHAGHHNGAGLPLADRCTNCHGSIHGTDVATPTGGSRFIDKGPTGLPPTPVPTLSAHAALPVMSTVPSHGPLYAAGAGAALGMLAGPAFPSGGGEDAQGPPENPEAGGAAAAYSITPGAYRFVDGSGFLGRVGEYDTLQQSAGADAVLAYVLPANHLTIISRANVLTGDDYAGAAQLTAGEHLQAGFDLRGFVQQQDTYPFFAGVMSPDLLPITDLIPPQAVFAVRRRLGNAHARVKLPKLPVHLFVEGAWQARSGVSQLRYLNENATATCNESCHYTTQFQAVNYTTRKVSGGADIDIGPVRIRWIHAYSSFNDRLQFPVGTFGPFTPEDEPPPPPVPVAPDIPAGNYFLDIPSPNQSSTDSLALSWLVSSRATVNGQIAYARLRNTFTRNPQDNLNADATLSWRPLGRLRVTADYHQHNLINDFTPFFDLFGNVSYHQHSEGIRLDYELPAGFDVEARYRRSGITRSNAFLWPQPYSYDNTDLLTVVPASFSNLAGLALRYHDRGRWSARAGYEWTGTHHPGYLVVPQSNNRVFADFTLTPVHRLTLTNDTSIIAQNAFAAIPLTSLSDIFRRRNRFYVETVSATLNPVTAWNLGLGYSYQQNNLNTYLAFQNDGGAGYVLDQPAVLYKQISQAYWAESGYTFRRKLGVSLRVTYDSARSGFRPNLDSSNPAAFGNAALITDGTFDPVLFGQALGNLQLGATQVSQVLVPQWIGQSKAYYAFPHKFEGGVIFYYGSYRDELNPNLNGVLRTFNLYVGRWW